MIGALTWMNRTALFLVGFYLFNTFKSILAYTMQFQLTNPADRSEFFKLIPLKINSGIQRLEGYTILLVTKGAGIVVVGDGEHRLSGNTLICLSPYEPFRIMKPAEGYQLTFHPDFLCVYKHHDEVACNGVLFDNIYGRPLLSLDNDEMNRLLSILDQMKNEFSGTGLAKQEVLVSLLKIFLVNATRIKVGRHPSEEKRLDEREPVVLMKLKDALEKCYKEKHNASAYAALLNVSTKSLSRLTRSHFNKSLSELIADRVFIEAKRELYLSSKTVKEIAYALGFKDEFYFSRFFKKRAKVSPQRYRETIGYDKMDMINA